MLYERYDKPPLTRRAFLRRMLKHLGAAGVLVLVSLRDRMLGSSASRACHGRMRS
jgi:hypothetical protein